MTFFGAVPPRVRARLQRDLNAALTSLPSCVSRVELYGSATPYAQRLVLQFSSGRQLSLEAHWPEHGDRISPAYSFSLLTPCCNAESILEMPDFKHHCVQCSALTERIAFHGYLNCTGPAWNTYYTAEPLKAMLDSVLDPLLAELETEAVEAFMETFLTMTRSHWQAGRAFSRRPSKPPAGRADGRDRQFRTLAYAGENHPRYSWDADQWERCSVRGEAV